MSANESKLYTFKEREWVVTGWAEGQMETEREDDKGQKVIVMQPYYQLFVISPVSSYKSDNYSAILVAKGYFRAAAKAAAGEYLSTMILCSMKVAKAWSLPIFNGLPLAV